MLRVLGGPKRPVAVERAAIDGGQAVVPIGQHETIHGSDILAPLRYGAVQHLRRIGVPRGGGGAFDSEAAFPGNIGAAHVQVVEMDITR